MPYESFFGKRSLVIVDISILLVVNDFHLKIYKIGSLDMNVL